MLASTVSQQRLVKTRCSDGIMISLFALSSGDGLRNGRGVGGREDEPWRCLIMPCRCVGPPSRGADPEPFSRPPGGYGNKHCYPVNSDGRPRFPERIGQQRPKQASHTRELGTDFPLGPHVRCLKMVEAFDLAFDSIVPYSLPLLFPATAAGYFSRNDAEVTG